MGPGETKPLTFTLMFNTLGTHQLYFQADTCDTASIGPTGNCLDLSYGRVAETNEANNIFGPITVNIVASFRNYLPLIHKQ